MYIHKNIFDRLYNDLRNEGIKYRDIIINLHQDIKKIMINKNPKQIKYLRNWYNLLTIIKRREPNLKLEQEIDNFEKERTSRSRRDSMSETTSETPSVSISETTSETTSETPSVSISEPTSVTMSDTSMSDTSMSDTVIEPISKGRLKVIIIGGGPVGMITALLINRTDKQNNYDINIYEKYSDFIRKQLVLITPSTQKMLRNFIDIDKLCNVSPPFTDIYGNCFKEPFILPGEPGHLKSISIKKLEKILRHQVNETENIKIHNYPMIMYQDIDIFRNKYENIITYDGKDLITLNMKTNIKTILNMKNVKFIIGADGINSTVAKIFNLGTMQTKFVSRAYIHLFSSNVSKNIIKKHIPYFDESKQLTQNRFRLFLNTHNFRSIDPHYLGVQLYKNEDVTKESLQETLKIAKLCFNINSPDFFNISDNFKKGIFDINVGKRENVSKYADISSQKIPIFLVGDSAIGVNFFTGTGVNAGFLMAKYIATYVAFTKSFKLDINRYEYFLKNNCDIPDNSPCDITKSMEWGLQNINVRLLKDKNLVNKTIEKLLYHMKLYARKYSTGAQYNLVVNIKHQIHPIEYLKFLLSYPYLREKE